MLARPVALDDEAEVQQVVDAGQLLLDDLGDRLLDRLGAGAGVGRAHGHLWRRDVGVGLNAEAEDRDHARERDQDRNDPGEDRVV